MVENRNYKKDFIKFLIVENVYEEYIALSQYHYALNLKIFLNDNKPSDFFDHILMIDFDDPTKWTYWRNIAIRWVNKYMSFD